MPIFSKIALIYLEVILFIVNWNVQCTSFYPYDPWLESRVYVALPYLEAEFK